MNVAVAEVDSLSSVDSVPSDGAAWTELNVMMWIWSFEVALVLVVLKVAERGAVNAWVLEVRVSGYCGVGAAAVG